MSLRALTILFLAAFGAATALTGYLMFTASHRAIIASVDSRIDEVADALLTGVAPGDAPAILVRIDIFSSERENGDIGFELLDASGRRIGGNVTLRRQVPFGMSSLEPDDRIAGVSAGRVEMRSAGGGLRLITIGETEPIDGYDAIRLRNYLIGFGTIALIVIAGTATFGMIVRRRIAEVRETAEAIIHGDLRSRVPIERTAGVFTDQALTFNRMLDRIETLMDGLRNVSSDVAHDLRTPLTRLRGRLSTLAARDMAAQDEADVAAALAACDELLAMFGAVLRIADVEGGDRRSQFAPLDLTEIAREVGDAMSSVADESGHRLAVVPGPAVAMVGDRQLLTQALFNLVGNALRYTPEGSTVIVDAVRTADAITLSVCDDGPGIDAADRSTALRRFGRLDRSRHNPGHGLGLPLVEAVARLHGGTLTLADAAPGLIATLRLPTGA